MQNLKTGNNGYPRNQIVEKPFTEIFDIEGGTQPPKSEFVYEPKDGYIRLLQIRDFGENPVPTYIPVAKKLKSCNKNDILIGRYGASVGKICTGMEGAYNVALAKVVPLVKMDRRFIYHLLTSNFFQEKLRRIERSAQNGFNKDDLSFISLPIIENFEKQVQVAKQLDTIFTIVSTAKVKLFKARIQIKKFRQAILSAAITGKLTEKLRYKNNFSEWEPTTIKHISTDISYGYTSSAKRDPVGPKLLRITDIQDGKVDWENVPYCNIETSKINKYKLRKGDIVFARTGATTGKSFLLNDCPISVFASYLIRVQPNKDKVSPEYLYLFFQSNNYWQQIASQVSGSAQPNCNATKLASLDLELPSLLEQKEIVNKVDDYFVIADKVENQIDKAEAQVSKLTQAILAKTFSRSKN